MVAVVDSFKRVFKAPGVPLVGNMTPLLGGWADSGFETYVREGYQKNEIVYSAIELLATSAAEPAIKGRRYPDASSRARAQAYYRFADVTGFPKWAATEVLGRKQIQQELAEQDNDLVRLLNHPNPYTSRFQMWSTAIMDRYIAGNAYLLKARDRGNKVRELWRLRPDRVRIIPDRESYIAGYTYKIGAETITLPPDDVLHFKTRNPLDDYYGMPPLMPLIGRIDLDNYMSQFVRTFFRKGGQPGAILSVKQKLNQDAKNEIRERFRRDYAGGNWFDLMVLDATESTYTPMTMQLGQRGLVMPELNNITEARIAMAFGIPASILGLLVGLESSSYANKRQDWQVLWDVTLAPLYSDLDDVLNLSLTPEFEGVDEVLFDLSMVKALQEDVDKLHERARRNVTAGLWTVEEGRILTGVSAETADGTFLIPANAVATPADRLGEMPEPSPEQMALSALKNWLAPPAPVVVEEPRVLPAPKVQRIHRRVERDAEGFISGVYEEVIDAS